MADGRTEALWAEWLESRSVAARDELVICYLPLVNFLAARVCGRRDDSQRQDVVAFGVLGLLDALERYRPEAGTTFETYGSVRIRGAMVDGVRVLHWLPRRAMGAGSAFSEVVPVDFHSASVPGAAPLCDVLSERSDPPVSDAVELESDHAEVASAVARLPERERAVVVAHYYRRRTLREIGAALGVTASRACQIHKHALELLAETLRSRARLA